MAFTIIAHRGDSANAPENTIAAFDAALSAGFTHFETDAQLSADGQAVVLHDEALGRTNDGRGRAADLTLQQLQQLDAGSWFGAQFAGQRIPALRDVLLRYAGRAHVHLVRE
jgi:glycerophosphoryl diester phosphodiesterase